MIIDHRQHDRAPTISIPAVAHSLPKAVYHVVRASQPYAELGVDYFDRLDAARVERHHVRRLEQLGNSVTLKPMTA